MLIDMQKIVEQDLGGSEDTAESTAQYTWQKDEVAWYFCNTYYDVFKVKFTGEHWITGNKWGRRKIYQYEYLETSGHRNIKTMGLQDDGISHGEENTFFSTPEEAIDQGFKCIQYIMDDALTTYNKNMLRLTTWEKKIKSEKTPLKTPVVSRDCHEVISKMLELVPTDKVDFIKDLKWNAEDASYKAPEERLQWVRTAKTLQTHIPNPKEDWEFAILSIFTTKSVEELKSSI